jgi:hypothetical protein
MVAALRSCEGRDTLFLEDDVLPTCRWRDKLRDALRTEPEWDVVNLYYTEAFHPELRSSNRSEFNCCTQAMLFRSDVAARVAASLVPSAAHADLVLSDVMKSWGIRPLTIIPSLFQHEGGASTAGQSNRPHTSKTFVGC